MWAMAAEGCRSDQTPFWRRPSQIRDTSAGRCRTWALKINSVCCVHFQVNQIGAMAGGTTCQSCCRDLETGFCSLGNSWIRRCSTHSLPNSSSHSTPTVEGRLHRQTSGRTSYQQPYKMAFLHAINLLVLSSSVTTPWLLTLVMLWMMFCGFTYCRSRTSSRDAAPRIFCKLETQNYVYLVFQFIYIYFGSISPYSLHIWRNWQ